MIGQMTTSFFADQKAHAHPGSFDAKVRGESVGLPPDVVKLAEEFGATDTEQFASFCWVFAQDVAARLHWREVEVSRATEQLYLSISYLVSPYLMTLLNLLLVSEYLWRLKVLRRKNSPLQNVRQNNPN